MLTETEVASLYAKRERFGRQADLDLETELRQWSSVPFEGTAQRVYLVLRARPLAGDRGLAERAARPAGGSNVVTVLQQVTEEGSAAQAGKKFDPNLSFLAGLWERGDADSWGATFVHNDRPELAMRVQPDGSAVLFSRRAGDINREQQLVVFEEAIAGLTSGFLRALGGLYWRAGYLGAVDVGLLVRPLDGAFGLQLLEQMREKRYPSKQYSRQIRLLAGPMRDEPYPSARALVNDLTTALVGEGYDPFH
jgi:hypothetical protein